MRKPEFITAKEAVDRIKSGSTICTIGMTLVSACESILKELENRFLETGSPNQLTYMHTCGQSDRKAGAVFHLAHEGLTKRIIGGHWGLCPKMMELISANKVEAYNLPQGQMANMFHSMALREPGKISKVGLGTFIDPRIEGGKMNDRTKPLEDIVDVVEIDGEEYLRYREIPIDTLLIRGTYADENGNPSLSSKLILEREYAIIPTIDVLVAFLQEKITAGTLGEIMYAAQNKKPMYIYYMPSPTESDLYNTNQWYVIGMAEKINPGNVHVKEVTGITDLLNQLNNDFNIKTLRYPNEEKVE